MVRGQRSVLVVDSSKIGRVTLARVVDLAAVDDVVTDDGASVTYLRAVERAGPRVHVVQRVVQRVRPAGRSPRLGWS